MTRTTRTLVMAASLTALAIPAMLFAPAAHAQTYKPDFTTKVVMAGSGTDVTKTVTMQSGTPTTTTTYTWPGDAPNTAGYVLSSSTSGGLSWIDPTGSIQHDATLQINGSNQLGINLGNANTWTATQTLPTTAAQAAALVASINASTSNKSLNADVLNYGSTLTVASHVLDIDLTHPNTWTGQQTFSNSASTSAAAVVSNTHNNASDIGLTVSTTNASGTALNVTSGNVNVGGLTASRPVKTDASKNLVSGLIDLTSANDVTGTLPVGSGGTGQTTLTQHGVVIGNGTSGVSVTAVGGDNTVLAGNAGADPTYKTLATDATLVGNGIGTSFGLALSHANTWTGTQTLGGAAYTSDITNQSTPFSASQNNLSLSASKTYFLLAATTAINITGIAGGVDGRIIVLVNAGNTGSSATSAITLKHASGSSSAANQFHLQGSSDIILALDGTATFIYDGTNNYWRLISAQ